MLRFSIHAMERIHERYGIKWTKEVEDLVGHQWITMTARDPDPRRAGPGQAWYTFSILEQDVRMLIDMADRVVVTCASREDFKPVRHPMSRRGKKRDIPHACRFRGRRPKGLNFK